MTDRNTMPRDHFDVLQRLLNCNKAQLAERLGVTPQTLRRWRALTEQGESPGKDAALRCSDLCRTILAKANADWMPLAINYDAIRTIGGRR